MHTARKRQSAIAVELPWRTPGYPGDTEEQPTRQQLGFKYVGIPFGTPAAGATGRKKTILRLGAQIGLKRGF